jgi:UDP-N-acetylmuramoyl-tripeptide--D-alanyl-D-alanine ligase
MATPQNTNRARFTVEEIIMATGGTLVQQAPDHDFAAPLIGVSTDTRTLTPGALYVALRGERYDGHQFLPQAAAAGAHVALVAEAAFAAGAAELPPGLTIIQVPDTLEALGALAARHRGRFKVPVVAVTGSYGKTTTRALVAAALSSEHKVLSSSGNFNNEVGLPLTLLQLNESHTAVVVEMGMRGLGQIEYLARIARPTIGVVTNIGPQHIELLHSMENIAAAKAELLEALPPEGVAILPADDQFMGVLRSKAPGRVVTFGQARDADYRVSDVQIDLSGNVACVITHAADLSRLSLKLPLPGAHNAVNAAAVMAVCGSLGIPLAAAAEALEKAEVPGGRMRVVRLPDYTIIDDCYNAGPNSMRAALDMLRDFPGSGRRVAVLGAMRELGDWSESEHRKIGAYAGARVALLVGVGPETRSLLETAQTVGAVPFHSEWCPDAASAAARVRELVREGDVVLVKGSRSVGLEAVVTALGGE